MSPGTNGRGARCASLCALAVAVAAPAVAGGAPRPIPSRLVDGSSPPAVPAALRSLGGRLVMTRVRIGAVKEERGLVSTCPTPQSVGGSEPFAERIGANGRDVTFLLSSREVAACDRDPRARSLYGPWCGRAGWTVYGGRVSDPRLTVCTRRDGAAIAAFGWIDPIRGSRWIVVDQPGFREVYPVVGELPVRVETVAGIDAVRGAVFRTTQYDARGRLLAARKVAAVIAS
ncbi:MAG TPA: hypothetical protein VLJ76_11745 [Gaiellaceae bacterium]|nr:hypothetical protein [Gaiellaceae bacterium]